METEVVELLTVNKLCRENLAISVKNESIHQMYSVLGHIVMNV
jgi:hypothetical protein